jgi:DNA-binding response OmpR family regulator
VGDADRERRPYRRRVRILVVEDDADIREGLSDLLRQYSFEVSSACEGQAALAMAHRTRPDVILLDALMEGMDGREFLDEQRRRPEMAGIPVVVITGLPPQLVVSLGAAVVLAKPFHIEDLLGAIRTALARPAGSLCRESVVL